MACFKWLTDSDHVHCSLSKHVQALVPRQRPPAAVIEAELVRLGVNEGTDSCNPRQTALAKEPADYFGFCG